MIVNRRLPRAQMRVVCASLMQLRGAIFMFLRVLRGFRALCNLPYLMGSLTSFLHSPLDRERQEQGGRGEPLIVGS
jgi:hypothetical protein